jgi:hypothetical protein
MRIDMQRRNLLFAAVFAIAMEYLEAAIVVDLRKLYGITDIMASLSSFDAQISRIEIGREAATLVMLWALGWIAGKKLQSRIGFFIFAFGVWDIFYYIWLHIFIGWPHSLLDWDLLFLIPLPWWGPILSPVLIALIMAIIGVQLVVSEARGIAIQPKTAEWLLLVSGILAMLYAFMADALAVRHLNLEMLGMLRPSSFQWPIFLVGFILSVASCGKFLAAVKSDDKAGGRITT